MAVPIHRRGFGVNSQMSRSDCVTRSGHFSFQNKWTRTRIAANHTQAITSSTFIRASLIWGITYYSQKLLTQYGHAEFQDGDLPQMGILISTFNDNGNHVGRNMRRNLWTFFFYFFNNQQKGQKHKHRNNMTVKNVKIVKINFIHPKQGD